MPLSKSSSASMPGELQEHFPSSPPPFNPQTFEEMETNKPAPAQDTAPGEVRPASLKRSDSGETERPASAQRVKNADANEDVDLAEEGEAEEDDWDPAQNIPDFDWEDLQTRYHNDINGAQEQEAALIEEWTQLMDFFKIWAGAGHYQETDRSFLRLRARMHYTQNSENDLEKTRNHYTQVVAAFESALALLNNAGMRN